MAIRFKYLFVFWVLPVAASATEPPPVAEADRAAVVEGNNVFAVELYGQLRTQPGNLFFSPASISTALAMTYAGARGDTAAEMARTLHFTLPPERLHPAMGALLRDLNAPHANYQFSDADALWGQKKGFPLRDGYRRLIKSYYDGGLQTVDFTAQKGELARRTINQWVEQQTKGRIQGLIQPSILKPTTQLVLTDAIYFKGDWDKLFDKTRTVDGEFQVSPTQSTSVPMMSREGPFNYFNGSSFQALEIPYNVHDLSMVIFLPRAVDGLAAFEHSMTPDKLQQCFGRLKPTSNVLLLLPKFKVEKDFQLKIALGAMGIRQAFGPRADFSGIADSNNRLSLAEVIHDAYVTIDENGTEAVAATAIPVVPPPSMAFATPIFRANHSFFFLIRNNRSGSILFMGRVTDPVKG